jgi:hypothetical protein
MRIKATFFRLAALGLIVMASLLAIMQLVRYARVRATFPTGMTIAGIPVAGLEFEQASQRLVQVYMAPIELRYGSARIQVRPATLGFELQINSMLAAADKQRTNEPFWSGYWKYLWNQPMTTAAIPLQANVDKDRIQAYLENEIHIRYDLPSTPPMPIPGDSGFYPGKAGTAMDYPITVQRIEDTLFSSSHRTVNVEVVETRPQRPSFDILEFMLKDVIDDALFDGVVELYFKDLQNGLVMHFAHSRIGEEAPPTNIAFSSWSTIKIPAMITLFKNLEAPYDPAILAEIEKMVEESNNESTDSVSKKVIEANLAPLRVTEDMQALGLQNTLWAGFFSLGSPLLQDISTPANSNRIYDTGPDRYAQTTVLDMGLLLEEIYYCAESYGGAIPLAFDGEITQEECQLMVEYLGKNKLGHLIEAGVPGGTVVAHKHGWANEVHSGVVHTMGDAAIVYTPGGNYILTIFVHQPTQVIFDLGNYVFRDLSAAIYNYYNLQ